MPYTYDFPSNVSAKYNTLKGYAQTLDGLLKEKYPASDVRLTVVIDDETALRFLNINFEINHNGKQFGIARTFTSASNMTDTNVNTNFNTFINSEVLPRWVEIISALI
jgi:hypothetical protein